MGKTREFRIGRSKSPNSQCFRYIFIAASAGVYSAKARKKKNRRFCNSSSSAALRFRPQHSIHLFLRKFYRIPICSTFTQNQSAGAKSHSPENIMPFPNFSKQAVPKALLASVLFAVLAGVAGSQLAPDMPLPTVLLYSAAGAAALLCLLVLVAVVTATYVQLIQRMGGTDSQWFWFSAEPPGLMKLREEAREANAQPQAIKK
jgi:hypothetical protein